MSVSVIVPARNAAATLPRTLESLLEQTFADWEAIVVDDGSTDRTAAIAGEFAAKDKRFRLLRQENAGVSVARNAGIAVANGEWLLFLDSDDWIGPQHLELMTGVLKERPELDAVLCGWVRVLPDGSLLGKGNFPPEGDLFEILASRCALAIHACLVRRSLVQAVGGFDATLATCEDWDLWQRVARTGTKFALLREVLAYYRMRPASLTTDGSRFLADGLQVIERGHGPDSRVLEPLPVHAKGLSPERLAGAKMRFACWPAAVALGQGQDARPLLEMLGDARDAVLDPSFVAASIFEAAPLPTCRCLSEWHALWPMVVHRLDDLLRALEERSKVPRLARRARRALEAMIAEQTGSPRPLKAGLTHAEVVEVTKPLRDVIAAGAERLVCDLIMEGKPLGRVRLPVCDGIVPASVLADAIVAEHAWPVLGAFFERTLYGDLRVEESEEGVAIFRGDLCLASGLHAAASTDWSTAHDHIGWTVFLQELWGAPESPEAAFYEPYPGEVPEVATRFDVELGGEIHDRELDVNAAEVAVTIGGAGIGLMGVAVEEGCLSAAALRAAINAAGGFELCRVAVREALLGRSFDASGTLRERLAELAGNQGQHGAGVTFGPRPVQPIGTSASRRAAFPAAALAELSHAATISRQPVGHFYQTNGTRRLVLHAPGIVAPFGIEPFKRTSTTSELKSGVQAHDGHHFEALFASGEDPWDYTNDYEQVKYEQTLSLLPDGPIPDALELACAEGHFTVQFAGRTGNLLAMDISQIALSRAAKRCSAFDHIRYGHCDLIRDEIPGMYDLVVCSEVLYYVGETGNLERVAEKIAAAIKPGGHFLTAHANLVVDEPDKAGFDWDVPFGSKVIGETFARTPGLHLVKELRTPLYRVLLFRRTDDASTIVPEFIEDDRLGEMPEAVSRHVLWNGGEVRRVEAAKLASTYRLPILMYHRVAPEGVEATSRWRVTPEAFEEQLRYLRDAGFYSVTLEQWREAAQAKKPLPGRAVLLTFDDGYRDFAEHAWPLLKRYGFTAIMFLVAGRIGGTNEWDRAFGEEVELMDWDEILRLQKEGVEFGAHTVTHEPLTGLSPTDLVRELVRSRAMLEAKLKYPVDAIAYPYGDQDRAVQHLTGACGYTFGLSCKPGTCRFQDSLLELPRIEVMGGMTLPEFVVSLGS
ncbi:trifunctional glycosyltransferase/class I SAM-dependent methyltransferase/polysaccharide deacetylase [Luteolibacter soli]|uniref:Trifunctional glycosyltransferase/class I SAM-dependent methyltransferase/polysaccharide deacetylase n=1 Tax=Luteolibacter soli TaxID=3135280 RepID=A0ABU9AQB9_9BACT